MTGPQSIILVIVAAAAVFFAWGRWRSDLVAVAALCTALVSGVLEPQQAFGGAADAGLISIAAIMVLGSAVRDAGLFDAAVDLIERLPKRLALRGALTGGCLAVASALITCSEASEAFRPAVQATARQTGRSSAALDAPLTILSLLGGTLLLTGSVPALIVSAIRRTVQGADFEVYSLFPVGAAVVLAALVPVAFYWRKVKAMPAEALDVTLGQRALLFTSEVAVPAASSLAGQSVREIEAGAKARIAIEAIIHEDLRRVPARPDWVVGPGDIIVVSGEIGPLRRLVERFGLAPAVRMPAERASDPSGVVEAVVTPASTLVGQSQSSSGLEARFGLNLLAVGRHGHEGSIRLRRLKLQAGDVLVFQGAAPRLRRAVADLGCLVLVERRLRPGGQQILVSFAILLGAIVLAAVDELPLAVALLSGVVLLVLFNRLSLAELYATIRWPTLVESGALLALGTALFRSGTADALVHAALAGGAPPAALLVPGTLSLTLVAATLVRAIPSAALLSPLAVSVAQQVGVPADPLLAAVAIGCACDLRMPVGAAAGGAPPRRFGDAYTGLRWIMAAVVVGTGSLAISAFWPMPR